MEEMNHNVEATEVNFDEVSETGSNGSGIGDILGTALVAGAGIAVGFVAPKVIGAGKKAVGKVKTKLADRKAKKAEKKAAKEAAKAEASAPDENSEEQKAE